MIDRSKHNFRYIARRRGSVYLAILGVSLIVVTMAVGAIVATRVQSQAADTDNDIIDARLYAQSGLELTRLWMNQTPAWRASVSGTTPVTLNIGVGTVSITAVDPIDGNLANRPYDPVVVTVTAQKGKARQILKETLVANPVPLPALQYAIHTAGQLHVRPAGRLSIGSATASTNGNLRNENIIEGNASVLSSSPGANAAMYGNLTIGAASKALPDPGVTTAYSALGTSIAPGNTINNRVLTPTLNPWGATNADGVYVINTNNPLTISNTRINGTLVIITTKPVTISGNVLFQPARSDYPVLIVNGDLTLNYNSNSSLSELSQLTNFNPAGAPYNGVSDIDILDNYPSEIQGLVHVTGKLTVQSPCIVRGAVICESAASPDAVNINDNFQIIYTKSLFTNPPQFYTASVPMVVQAGSLTQVVN